MNPTAVELNQAVRILKWLSNNLKLGEASLKSLEKRMLFLYAHSPWDELELNNIRMTMYCTVSCMFIWYSSFTKEFEKHFTSLAKRFDSKMFEKCNLATQEYFRTVDSIFPNLNKIRNTILAHGYRWFNGVPLKDIDIDNFMNEITNRGSLHPYYQLSNLSNLIIDEIEKNYGQVNEELILNEFSETDE